MARILAIANVKGGVGKTTTTANLAAALAARGRKVLGVDLDPQASLTVSLGFQPDQLTYSIRDALNHKAVPIASMLLHTSDGFDLAPANYALVQTAAELEKSPPRLAALRSAIDPVLNLYDYILLDCPASAGILTGAALTAADEVIIPLTADYLTFQALKLLLRIIKEIQRGMNPGLRVGGIFYSMYDSRTRHAREIHNIAQSVYGSGVPFFSTSVRVNVSLKEAASVGKSVIQYAPASTGAQAYRDLAQEIEQGLKECPENQVYFSLGLGNEALAHQDYESAYTAFCQATTLNPQIVRAWLGRAESAPDWMEAVRSYARAQELEPSVQAQANLDMRLREGLATAEVAQSADLVTLAFNLAQLKQTSQAESIYRRVTELDPAHEGAWLGLARTTPVARQGVQYAERGLEINPHNPLAQVALAEARDRVAAEANDICEEGLQLERKGERRAAHQRFRQASELDPQSEGAWLGQARTAEDYGAAFQFARRALEINPENAQARELSRLLWNPEDSLPGAPAEWKRLVLPTAIIMLMGLVILLARFMPQLKQLGILNFP